MPARCLILVAMASSLLSSCIFSADLFLSRFFGGRARRWRSRCSFYMSFFGSYACRCPRPHILGTCTLRDREGTSCGHHALMLRSSVVSACSVERPRADAQPFARFQEINNSCARQLRIVAETRKRPVNSQNRLTPSRLHSSQPAAPLPRRRRVCRGKNCKRPFARESLYTFVVIKTPFLRSQPWRPRGME